MDDVAAQQHPAQWPQLWPPPAEVSVGVCHPNTDECPRGLVDFWCHLSVCRDGAYETPYGPEEVQQGPRVPRSDHGPLLVLQSVHRHQQGHSTSHYQSLHREVLHLQVGAGPGTIVAWGGSTNAPSPPQEEAPSLRSISDRLDKIELRMDRYMCHMIIQ